jgi:hypothetical protein
MASDQPIVPTIDSSASAPPPPSSLRPLFPSADNDQPYVPPLDFQSQPTLMAPKEEGGSDTLNLLKSSFHSTVGSLLREGAVRAQAAGMDNLAEALGGASRLSHMNADDAISKVSQETQDLVNAPVTSGQFWSHPLSALGYKAVSAAVPVAATIAGAINLPTEAVTGSILMSAAAADAQMAEIDKLSDAELQRREPLYKQLRDSGVSEAEARDEFGNRMIAQAHTDMWAGLAGGVTGAFFPAGQFKGAGNLLFGRAPNVLGRAWRSGVEAGAAGAGADLGVNLALNYAAGTTGIGEQKSPEEMIGSAATQAVGQGLFGVVAGAANRPEKEGVKPSKIPKPADVGKVAGSSAVAAPPVQSDQAVSGGLAPGVKATLEDASSSAATDIARGDLTQTGGEATIKRTSREGRKPEAKTGAEQAPSSTTTPASASPVSDDTAIALAANKPTIDSSKQPIPPVEKIVQAGEAQPAVARPEDQQGAPPAEIARPPVPPPQPAAQPQPAAIVSDSSGIPGGQVRPPVVGEKPPLDLDQFAAPPKPAPSPTPPAAPEARAKPLYEQARDLVIDSQRGSLSFVQRMLKLPYEDAARIVNRLQQDGVIGPANRSGARKVLVKSVDELPEKTVPIEPVKETPKEAELPIVKASTEIQPTARIVQGPETPEQRLARLKAESEAAPTTSEKKIAKLLGTEGVQPGHMTKSDLLKRQNNNAKAEEVVKQFPITEQDTKALAPGETPDSIGARNAAMARLQNMVAAADAAKVTMPKEFNKMTSAAQDHSPAVLLLNEAKRFLATAKSAGTEEYTNYLLRENALRHGQYEDVLAERRAEAEEAKARQGIGPRAGKVSLEKILSPIKKVEKAAQETEEPKSAAQAEAGNYPHGKATFEGQKISLETAKGQTRKGIDKKGREWVREDYPDHYGYILRTKGADGDHLDVHIGPKGETGKIFVMNQLDPKTGMFDEHKVFLGYDDIHDTIGAYAKGFTDPKDAGRRIGGVYELSRNEFQRFKDEGDLHQPIGEGLAGQQLSGYVATKSGSFLPTSHQSLKGALNNLSYNQFDRALRPFMGAMVRKLADIVGDVHVYGIHSDALDQLEHDKSLAGYYQQQFNHIVIRDGMSPEEYTHTLIHEAVHAATIHSLDAVSGFRDLTYKLMQHTKQAMKDQQGYEDYQINKMYAFAKDDPAEFLAEAMSNRDFQVTLSQLDISPEMAKELGYPAWRKASIWRTLVDKIREALYMPAKSTSALEAAMAVTEYSTWAKRPADQLAFMGAAKRAGLAALERTENSPDPAVRLTSNIKSLILDTPHYMKRQENNAVENDQRITSKFLERAASAEFTASRVMIKAMSHLLTSSNLFDWAGKDFQVGADNAMRKVIDWTERRGGIYRQIREGDAELGRDITVMAKKYQGTEEAKIFDRLLETSSRYRVHPDDPLGEGRNARYKIGPKTNVWDESSENFLGRAHYDEVAADYQKLPPELQKLYRDLRDFYQERGKAISDVLIDKTLRSYDPPPGSTHEQVIKRYQDGKQTEADELHYENAGLTQDIRDAMRFTKERGPYFPVYRAGNYVVYGYYPVQKGGFATDINGQDLEKNIREFNTRQEAYDFITKHTDGLHSDMHQQYFIKPTVGGPWHEVTADEAHSNPTAQTAIRFRVNVQNKRMELKDTAAEAVRIMKEMHTENMEYVSQVLERRELGSAGMGKLLGSHVAAIERRIQDHLGISQGAKDQLIDMLHETLLASQTGNKAAQHFMQRYNVQGGEWANPRAYDAYSNATAVWLANERTRPTIDSALKQMNERAQEMEGSKNAYRMSVMVNEMNHRAGLSDRAAMNPQLPRWMQTVLNWNFMRYLASPAHLLMHMVHVPMFVAPYLGSQYGYGAGYRGLAAAYRDLGGVWPAFSQSLMTAGKMALSPFIKNVQKELEWERGANYLETLTRNIKNPSELRLFRELAEDNHIHPNSGMDIIAGRELGRLDRVNDIMREITGAPDTINRSVTALATFRLHMAKSGGDVDASIMAAKRALEFTQGQMTLSNAAPWMKAPWVRPFMQFRQFPMQISYMLGKTIYNLIKNEEPGVRNEAFKFAAGLLGTTALLTGVNGMPTEMLKIPAMIGAALGITKMPSEYDEEIQAKLTDWFGPTMANVIMNGPLAMLGPVAPYIPHRAGMSSLWTFGEPSDDKPDALYEWGLKTVFGGPGSSAVDAMNSVREYEKGNYANAVAKILPFSWGSHIVKAWQLAEEGKPTEAGRPGLPAQGILPAIPELFGFTSQMRARYQTGQAALYSQTRRMKVDRSTAISQMATATNESERIKLANRWNQEHPDDPVRGSDILAEMRRRAAPEAFGFPINRRNQQRIEQLKMIYGQ